MSQRISLNALRVFATVARTGSLTVAGKELHVTASAVSHQIRKLERELGVSLLRRAHNSIALTDIGQRLHHEVAMAIGLIERSVDALHRDETEISVQASTSLAVRWLIPSLDRFRARCASARVRVETSTAQGFSSAAVPDVAIRYFRAGEAPGEWELLVRDMSRPVVSARLLAAAGTGKPGRSLAGLPALQRAAGNWDWKLWCGTCHVALAEIGIVHTFDTDDAALHACVAGLGVVLAPPILTQKEIESGALVVLPGHAPVEIGSYRFQRRSDSRVARQFCDWLCAEAASADTATLTRPPAAPARRPARPAAPSSSRARS